MIDRIALEAALADAEIQELFAVAGELQALALTRLTTGPTKEQSPETALSPETVARRLDLPPSKVYHLLRSGHLRGAKVGKYWRVLPSELASYLRQRSK